MQRVRLILVFLALFLLSCEHAKYKLNYKISPIEEGKTDLDFLSYRYEIGIRIDF